MATIRQRKGKYEVQIRRSGNPHLSRTFHTLKNARAGARQSEVQADRNDLPPDRKALQHMTLGQLVERYRDTVSVEKRDRISERYTEGVSGSPDMLQAVFRASDRRLCDLPGSAATANQAGILEAAIAQKIFRRAKISPYEAAIAFGKAP